MNTQQNKIYFFSLICSTHSHPLDVFITKPTVTRELQSALIETYNVIEMICFGEYGLHLTLGRYVVDDDEIVGRDEG